MINTLYTTIGHRAGDINIITPVALEFPGLGYTYLAVREGDLADPKMRKALKRVRPRHHRRCTVHHGQP